MLHILFANNLTRNYIHLNNYIPKRVSKNCNRDNTEDRSGELNHRTIFITRVLILHFFFIRTTL